MSRAFPPVKAMIFATAVLVLGAAHAQERTVYRCIDASGKVVFSDTECVAGKTAKLSMKSLSEEELAKRKAEHDANTARDTSLANQTQANRLANEQAARAAQAEQGRLSKSIADQMEQERNQKNATVTSAPNVATPVPFTGP